MRIWIYLESVNPVKWGVRAGRKWHIVNKITINIPMETRHGRHAPQGYLVGHGKAFIKNGHAVITQ